ncbi:RHS repeat-associated core domain-containing protein [Oerskovia paurometabola]
MSRAFSNARFRASVGAAVGTTLLAGLLVVAPSASAQDDLLEREGWTQEERIAHGLSLYPEIDPEKPVSVTEGTSRPAATAQSIAASAAAGTTWPQGGAVDLSLPPEGGEASGSAGGLPVSVVPLVEDGAVVDSEVSVEVFDQRVAAATGVDGVVLEVATAAAEPTSPVELTVDYSGFAGKYGGDWASRLRLVGLPDCALSTPDQPECQESVPLTSTNDVESSTVTARVEPAAFGAMALTAGAAGGAGNWSATPLSASASWQAGGPSGNFSWSYPMRVVPSPGGLAPELALSYSSGGLDGRVVSTNNQSSWVGDGWDLWSGYVERKYTSCSEDAQGNANNLSRKTGDLCWKSDNATLVFNGMSTELVKDVATGTWKPESDDGSRVERLTGAWNGDNDTEYWKVTTPDGTQYFFGRDKRSATDPLALGSAWTVPVYGNHPGEPCYQATFEASSCTQGWKWNLDYVVDPFGNSLTYTYGKETNSYGRNLNTAVSSYDRGGYLKSVEYGTRAGAETGAQAPMRVDFTVAERCLPTGGVTCAESELTAANASKWPDVPFDLICSSTTTCPTQSSPSFFTRKRLTSVTTKVLNGASYREVDSWTLGHQLPDPGDGSDPVLWLSSIEHKGLAGGTITLPKVTFIGQQMANRVDTLGDHGPPMNRLRVIAVNSESGGTISVNYSPIDCTSSNLPASPETNTRRCFPVFWTPEGLPDPIMEYFHKYLVTSVVSDGRDSQSQATETRYSYVGAPAWHYDDSELTPPKQRTWAQFRGYGTVDVITGASTTTQLKTRYRYFRGMDGDRAAPAGGVRSVAVDGITDHDRFSGMTREETTYNGAEVVSTSLSTPWRSPATATGADGTKSYFTGESVSETRTTAPNVPGGVQTTRTVTTYDDTYGSPVQVEDLGDVSTAADDKCTRLEYARNTTANILSTVKRSESVAVACGVTPSRPGDVVNDERMLYDGAAYGVAPTKGRVTATQQVKSFSGATPEYLTTMTSTFDALGRAITQTDALGRTTSMAYTPAGAGPVTKVVTTTPDPDGAGALTPLVTSMDLDPAWGVPVKSVDPNGKVTTATYDAFGRLTNVWMPDRPQATKSPSITYEYQVRSDGPNTVTTKTLTSAETYLTSVALYDGLLRASQTQAPSADKDSPGRIVTDQVYDTRGLVIRSNNPWFTEGSPGTTRVVPTTAVPARTVMEYDGAGRATAQIVQVAEQEKWRTTTTYGGDRVTVVPPAGGTPQTTISDARGNLVELRQYTSGSVTGPFQTTTYTYDKSGQLATTKDAAGNTWSNTYDLLGRVISASDPDKGTTSTTYDDAGQVVTTTDARGVVLASKYDFLGRPTETREGSLTGTLRSSWSYDTLAKGQLTSTTRFDKGNAYVMAVTAYDALNRPLGQSLKLPTSEGALAGTYTSSLTYTADGQVKTVSLPAVGNLPEETVGTIFDGQSLPSRVVSGNGGVYAASTKYSPYGEVLVQDLGDVYSTIQHNTYEHGTRRPTTAKVEREGIANLDLDVSYGYDAAGNITSISNKPVGSTSDTQCFTYDGLRRLTEAWTPASDDCATPRTAAALGGAAPYWTSYTFDPVGNRTSTTQHTTAGDRTSAYTYPAAGAARPHAVTQVTTTGTTTSTNTYGYDQSGNTTTRAIAGQPVQELAWDAEGKLDTVTEAGVVTDDYLYTPEGDRLLRRQDGATTIYLPGGQELTLTQGGDLKAIRYYSLAGQTVAVRTGVGAAGVDTLVADHHGTAEMTVNNATQQVTRRYHDPYGNARGASPTSWVDDKGFLGKPVDSTGLTSVGARYYDSQLGRFISVDPIMDLTDPQQWSAYAYADNNPVTYSDPTGLLSWKGAGKWLKNTVKSGSKFIKKYQGEIVGAVVGVVVTSGCLAVTAGAGSLGCMALGGAAGGAATNLWKSKVQKTQKFSLMGLARDTVMGGALGYLGGAGGRLLAPALGKASTSIRAAVSRTFAAKKPAPRPSSASSAAKPAGTAKASPKDSPEPTSCPVAGARSFSGGTNVLMGDRSIKPIKNVKPGDKVLAADPKTGRQEVKIVTRTWVHQDTLVTFTVGGKALTTTEDHPFWNATDKQWQDAQYFDFGDNILTADGFQIPTAGIQAGSSIVDSAYNLTVDDLHTYYVLVATTPVLVHNCGPTKTDRIAEHLTSRDLDAAKRELGGEVVARKADGTPWDHVGEVRDAQQGLLKRLHQVKVQMSKAGVDDPSFPSLQDELSQASKLLDLSEQYVPRH